MQRDSFIMVRQQAQFKVAIIGGGISGIAQAVTLRRQLGSKVDIKVSLKILFPVQCGSYQQNRPHSYSRRGPR